MQGFFLGEEAELRTCHYLEKWMWVFSATKIQISKSICVTNTFKTRQQISLASTFHAVKNRTTEHWHFLEESMTRTMTFNLLPRYRTDIWQDRTISDAFLELFALCRSTRSHISFRVVELLQQCHFILASLIVYHCC